MEELDLENRRLCPDDACIGILDEHGQCKECGRVDTRAEPYGRVPRAPEPEPTPAVSADAEDAPSDWDDRRLCPDGGCIGVLGADGRCRECGKGG